MVTAVTNLGRSGLYDWLIQRVSAVVLAAYTIFLAAFILLTPELDFGTWRALFDQFWMRLFSLVSLLLLMAHAWIGLWAVLTDYVTPLTLGNKAMVVRLNIQIVLGVVTFAYTLWGIEILWRI